MTVAVAEKLLDGEKVQALASQLPTHLDLHEVELVTASGLGQLVALHEALEAAGEGLVLENVPPRPCEVFEVTKLNEVLEVRAAR
jgi:anti-anti-sigma regulatory factor